MNPQTIRILVECDTMLQQIAARYQLAIQRLEEASPGFPAHTPGAGEPGGGTGYTAGSITERLAERQHPELVALTRLKREPGEVMAHLAYFAHQLHIPPPLPHPAKSHVQLLTWSRLVTRAIVATDYPIASTALNVIHRVIINLHRTVTAWSYTPMTPVREINQQLLPEDPTEKLCRSCLRVGELNNRTRGYFCDWCYRFQRGEGFLPPPAILESRASGQRITEAMVIPHRKAHRESKKKRRKAS